MRNTAGRRRRTTHVATYSQYLTSRPRLPSYGRIADSLDHILRICSRLRQLLTVNVEEQSSEFYREEMLNKSKALVHLLQRSPYAFHLFDKVNTPNFRCLSIFPFQDVNENSGLVDCLESLSQVETAEDLPQITKGFLDIVRKLVEETIHLNCWVCNCLIFN